MNKRTFILVSALALGLATQARAAEFGSLGLVNFNRVKADFNLNRSSALLANVGLDSVGAGYKYFLDRNHAGFNLAARGNLSLKTPTARLSVEHWATAS